MPFWEDAIGKVPEYIDCGRCGESHRVSPNREPCPLAVMDAIEKRSRANGRHRERSSSNGNSEAAETATTDRVAFEHLTDLGNARRFVTDHGENVRYVAQRGGWFIWDGRRWQLDDTAEVERLAKETVARIWTEVQRAEDADERKRIALHAHKSESASRLQAMLRLAQSEPEVVARPSELDADPFKFNVLNGTIDLRTGELHPHERRNLITELAPVEYDPDATCPTWIGFLERVLGNDLDLFRFVQRALGYSLTGDTSEQCLFIFHGTGANGKSTLLETVRATFGDYGQQAEFSTFMQMKDDGRPRNDVARLVGARFVAAIEVETGRRLAESLVKQLTGGDTIAARFLYREHFEFRPTFKIFLAANHKPVIRGADLAIWRRIKLVPFTVTIPPEERDRKLPQKLRNELPGILAWAVRGCLAWQRDGLREPDAVRRATGNYREESDALAGFFEDRCVVDAKAYSSARDLYAAYAQWCEDAGERAESQRGFGMRLAERGFDRARRERGVTWLGIGLRSSTGA